MIIILKNTIIKQQRRAIPIELINNQETNTYDVGRYTELLAETCNSITEPFGCTITKAIKRNSICFSINLL
jgi:hypothetical protein